MLCTTHRPVEAEEKRIEMKEKKKIKSCLGWLAGRGATSLVSPPQPYRLGVETGQ